MGHFSAALSTVSRPVSGDFGLILVTSWATFRPHFRPSAALFLVLWGSFWRLLGALSGHFSAAISTVSRIVSGDFGLLLETSRTTIRAQFRPPRPASANFGFLLATPRTNFPPQFRQSFAMFLQILRSPRWQFLSATRKSRASTRGVSCMA